MTTVHNPLARSILLARRLHTTTPRVHALLAEHPSLAELHDAACIEHLRPLLDTLAEAFVIALKCQGTALRVGAHRDESHSKTLIGFKQHTRDTSPTAAFYPVTKFNDPWHRHRVPVYKFEFEAAGYREFAALWKGAVDPFEAVPVNGEVLLGPAAWVARQQDYQELCPYRATFLQSLAEVIQLRGVTQ